MAGLEDFTKKRDIIRIADTVELQAGNPSVESGFLESVAMGTAGIAFSAVSGLVNTAVALGETVGLVDENTHRMDTYDALRGTFGQATADFYADHKTGLDAGGLIVGSLIPGMAAVRALRVAQMAGKLPMAAQVASGTRNADIVLGSKAVEAAKQASFRSGNILRTPQTYTAFRESFKQQIAENIAFEIGMLTTMNQHSMLNPEGLSYFDAAGAQFVQGLPFLAIGVGIGTGIDAMRIGGAIRKHEMSEMARTGKYSANALEVLTGLQPGDKLAFTVAEAKRRHQFLTENPITAGDFAAERALKEGDTILKNEMLRAITEMNFADAAGREAAESLVKKATSGELADIGVYVAGLSRMETISAGQMKKLEAFHRKTAATTIIEETASKDPISNVQLLAALEQRTEDFVKNMEAVFGADTPQIVLEWLNNKPVQLHVTSSETVRAVHQSQGMMLGGINERYPTQGRILTHVDSQGNQFLVVLGSGYIPAADNTMIDGAQLAATNRFRKAVGLGEMSPQEYTNYVTLHEIGHAKANNPKAMEAFMKKLNQQGEQYRAVGELLSTTYEMRGNELFEALERQLVMNGQTSLVPVLGQIRAKVAATKDPIRRGLILADELFGTVNVANVKRPGYLGTAGAPVFLDQNLGAYFTSLTELLADASGMLANPATRERFSKIAPNLAKFMNKHGGMVQSWNDKLAYYSISRGEVMASALPGIADVGSKSMKIVRDKATIKLNVPALSRSFEMNVDFLAGVRNMFKAGKPQKAARIDYKEGEAQWLIADKITAEDLIVTNKKTGDQSISISLTNLPLMEKVAQDDKLWESIRHVADAGNLKVLDDVGMSVLMQRDDMRKFVIAEKRKYRDAIASTGLLNEQEIARFLNISPEVAMGLERADGWLQLGTRDMWKPDLIAMRYKPMDMFDVYASTKSMAAVQQRDHVLQMARENVAELTLGQMNRLLPEISVEEVAIMSRMSSRAGMVSNLRAEFGSARERMQYVGRLIEKHAQQKVKDVADDFAKFSNVFNKPEAMHLRYELAQIDNIIRREWYHQVGNAIVRKNVLDELASDLQMSIPELKERLKVDQKLMDSLIGAGDQFAPDAVRVSQEVADFLGMHVRRNSSIVDKKQTVAGSKGRDAVLDPEALYPPPRDLTRAKHVAFVSPAAFRAGHDSRTFMIFAESMEEFNAKQDAIRKAYGNEYNIYTNPEVEIYKKYMGDYKEGLVFDELFFDSSIKRRGVASELLPSVDLQVSGTLTRYQDWHVRQETALLRDGVEAKYGNVVQYLRQMDEVTGAAERDAMSKKFRGPSTIYADSLATMLGKRATSGAVEDMYAKVNDYIGEKGSNLIDSLFGILRTDVAAGVTEEGLRKFNSQLAENGFNPPFAGVMETILTSPDPQVSRALPSLVRTLNNLAGTMMLRLDMAHSIVQLISSPILMMPVLLEAKQALRGTPNGAKLDALTSVINPATGDKEPTVMKLLTRGTKAFWSDEGKAFMAQLRERGIVNDYLRQYQEVMDFSQLNGRHQMKMVNDKIDKLAEFGSRWSGFTMSEEFTRFVTAHAAWEIGTLRGMSGNELWATVASAVDKVHGIYIGHQRPQLFQGVMGQAIGLYQTYFFNFMQNAMKYVMDGDKKMQLAMGGLQASIFGLQSFPGFHTFNKLIGETNRDNLDLYEVTDANDPRSAGAYFMFGLGSHALGVPIDLYVRGDLAIRNSTVVPNPLNPMEIPAVGMVARAVGNAYTTAKMMVADDVPAYNAFLHGMAHNGMNRPMQGLATILQGRVTSGRGQTYFENSNYYGNTAPDPDKNFIESAMSGEVNFGGMFARLIGTRPLDESIIMNHYFRQAAYQASTRDQIANVGAHMQMSLESGRFDREAAGNFMLDYEKAGGDVQNFNAFMMRTFQNARAGSMSEFRREMEQDGIVKRAYNRMLIERSTTPPWEY
jgi:hypothetical protein